MAVPLSAASSLAAAAEQQQSLVTKVQRRRGPRTRRPRTRRPHGSYHHPHHRGGIDPGAAAALGVIGAIGTMMALDAARQRGQAEARYDDAVEYCLRRFRSYDVYSGTYLGYDGYRHPCP